MPVPSSINDLSQTAGSNSPAGSESPSLIDDYLRTYAAFIAVLRDGAQNNSLNFAAAGGSANAITAAYSPAITTLTDGTILYLKAASANTAAATFSPNGLVAKAIVSLGHAALIGGEIAANGDVWLQYNSSIGGGSWVLIASSGGTASAGRLAGVPITFAASGTYTKTIGVNKIRVRLVGGGGAGGGTSATSASQCAAGGGGSAGAYAEAVIDVSATATIAITIGAGGTGVSGAAGNAGGTTSVGAFVTAPGGPGGLGNSATSTFPQLGSAGGSTSAPPTGANVVGTAGDAGGPGRLYSLASVEGGAGGRSIFGATNILGPALGYGSGGAGQRATPSSGAGTGSVGMPGYVIIEEIF